MQRVWGGACLSQVLIIRGALRGLCQRAANGIGGHAVDLGVGQGRVGWVLTRPAGQGQAAAGAASGQRLDPDTSFPPAAAATKAKTKVKLRNKDLVFYNYRKSLNCYFEA